MYFSGADMNVEEIEKKQIIKEHAIQKQAIVPPAAILNKDAVVFTAGQDIRNYQY
jgi:LysR family transcriptional regulator for metE and metH